ncbi:MAG: SUMF1/EgtB/PvdO family nonheme iron enzyme [Deltaproteobacteria bacterium]|nr:SUMF1/EgtB/PvdO family nonheme iron enzyme [Deltaproteobacteria bacterium]
MKRITITLFISLVALSCQKKGDGTAPNNMAAKSTSTENTASSDAPSITKTTSSSESSAAETENKNTVDRGVRPPRAAPQVETLEAPVFPPPQAGAMVDIPEGTLLRGSPVDDVLREQFAENDHLQAKMTPFQMDILPWPNDPALPPMTGVTQMQAAQYCESAGKRLCTEAEWEWACKSKDNRRYISGNLFNPASYSGIHGAPSPFGVWAMNKQLEWTASPWGKDADQLVRTAVRGFTDGQEFLGKIIDAPHGARCAKRWRFNPDDSMEALGFRCCKGTPNKASFFIERPRPAHSVYKTIKPEEFARIIRSIPQLAAIHDNPHMFSNADVRSVLAKRSTVREDEADRGIHFIWKPLRWIPRQGMELWLAVGRSNRHSFVVALHEVKDNEQYVHESSMIIWDNPIPLALAYREGHRDEVYWAPCWHCRDGGSFEYNEETNEVNIISRW